ncbi:MAG: GGDEF domain-containing protein [Xanthomonadales bacterium]|nr:GGDEF domain-containing protein [Xanthomonadales bacterium]
MFRQILSRLQADFELSIMALLCTSAALCILPFAVYRILLGDLFQGVLDLLIVGIIVGAFAYAWVTGNTKLSGIILTVSACLGGLLVTLVQGLPGLFWLFPAMLISFFLAPPGLAGALIGLVLVVLIFQGNLFAQAIETWSFFAASLVISASALILSRSHHRQRSKLERLATVDPLTGAKNRRAMMADLESIGRPSAASKKTALVMLDIDHFKKINDEFGHNVGDEVLAKCAQVLREHTRDTDQLFRYGGEEFVLLMPGMEATALGPMLEKLRGAVEENLATPAGAVTASMGAALAEPGEDWETWMARADRALYAAKEAGRNRVVLDDAI